MAVRKLIRRVITTCIMFFTWKMNMETAELENQLLFFRRFDSFSHQMTHIWNSWIDRYATSPTTTTTKFLKFRGAAEEASNAPRGEKAESGPDATASSGLGGLGEEGMVGMDGVAGEGSAPPGEGNSGAMSGDSSWKGGIGGELARKVEMG